MSEQSDALVTVRQLRGILRILVRMCLTAHVEALATQAVLQSHRLLPDPELEAIRTRLLREIEPLIQQYDEAPDDSLLEMLQRFEGRLQ